MHAEGKHSPLLSPCSPLTSNLLSAVLRQIYHPNVDLEGNVCLNILREDWKPVLNLNSVMVGLQYLFLEPNADDPLNKGECMRRAWAVGSVVVVSCTSASDVRGGEG